MKLRCIIVDDEPASRKVLLKYIADIPSLELVAECSDAFEASAAVEKQVPDLIFLDINLPRLSGLSFARSMHKAPMIVFTTAYPEYAVEGFELEALDYLVKPFSLERFLKAVNRAMEKRSQAVDINIQEKTMLIRSDKKIYALNPTEILFVEGCGDYIKLVRKGGEALIVHETMKGFEASLPTEAFMRVHKSYILQLKRVNYIDGNTAFIENHQVPLSPSLKQALLSKL